MEYKQVLRRTNHKELKREEYKWTRMLIKKEMERKRRKEKWNLNY
jgi:hypothetical protein